MSSVEFTMQEETISIKVKSNSFKMQAGSKILFHSHFLESYRYQFFNGTIYFLYGAMVNKIKTNPTNQDRFIVFDFSKIEN